MCATIQNATTILLRRDATSSVSIVRTQRCPSARWETSLRLSWVCFAHLVSAGHVRQASQPSLRASFPGSFRRGGQRLCSECLLDIRARYPLCKDEPRHPSEENCSCLWSYCRSGTALSCGLSSVIPTWCFYPRQQFVSFRNMGITTGRSCTPDITTTPKAFTQYRQQAAKLLNTPFVGNFKRLESCITRTTVHKENIIQRLILTRNARVKFTCNSSVDALTFIHPAAAFSWDLHPSSDWQRRGQRPWFAFHKLVTS